jgi:hypothetical protein
MVLEEEYRHPRVHCDPVLGNSISRRRERREETHHEAFLHSLFNKDVSRRWVRREQRHHVQGRWVFCILFSKCPNTLSAPVAF